MEQEHELGTPSSAEAAERFVRRLHSEHANALFGWAQNRFHDREDAEEIVAETLARAWRFHDTFDPQRGSERSWIFGIARNTAVDHFRKSRRHLQLVSEEEPGPEAVFDDPIERIAEASIIRDVLDALPDHQRSVIIETFFMGRTTNQVAGLLGIPDGTVKSRLFYGLKALRAALEERGVLR